MNGAGNDFVIIDARKEFFDISPEKCQEICNRKSGIGCDQLIIIDHSDEFDCVIKIYNSSGSIAESCGNATRCVASILLSENKSLQKVKIKSAANILEAWLENDNMIAVKMGKIKFDWQNIPLSKNINTQGFDLLDNKIYCANIGNPHAVIFLDHEVLDNQLLTLGPQIENHSLFPNKTNVEFAYIASDSQIIARVWERGAGETRACGSGACAIAAIAIKNKMINNNKVTIKYPGGDIIIEWSGDENDQIVMIGGYELEFKGCFP